MTQPQQHSIDDTGKPNDNSNKFKTYRERKKMSSASIQKIVANSSKQDRRNHPFRKQWGKRSKNAVPYSEWLAKQGE